MLGLNSLLLNKPWQRGPCSEAWPAPCRISRLQPAISLSTPWAGSTNGPARVPSAWAPGEARLALLLWPLHPPRALPFPALAYLSLAAGPVGVRSFLQPFRIQDFTLTYTHAPPPHPYPHPTHYPPPRPNPPHTFSHSRLPWDPVYLVESLSDSTIYMAYYAGKWRAAGHMYRCIALGSRLLCVCLLGCERWVGAACSACRRQQTCGCQAE